MAITTPVTGTVISVADFGAKVTAALNAMSLPIMPGAAIPPMSGLQAAGMDLFESSGSAVNNAKPAIYRLLFDKDTDEGREWIFRVPTAYVSTPVLHLLYYSTGANTSKTFAANAMVACGSDGDASFTAKVYAATNQQLVTVPDAAGTLDVVSITLTNADSMAAGDWCNICVWRDVSNDDAANDIAVLAAALTFAVG